MISRPITWRIGDRLKQLPAPCVMGILNATPDSFHPGSRVDVSSALRLAERMLIEGAAILDIGGASSRPGSAEVDTTEELRRVVPVIAAVHARFPEALLSVDTSRAAVVREAVAAGAGLVNDIGAGLLDPEMLPTVATLHVPYIAMHMQGNPATMQLSPTYADVAGEVTLFLSGRIRACKDAGIADVIIDPGFGFGKTTDHNYALLRALPRLAGLGAPVLVGVSRKRMITEVLGTTAATALNGTTILNTLAVLGGAAILRVHDVLEATEVVKLTGRLQDESRQI
ncbi:MAG: dihydropteroate synthase [Flavobacteriales bacterium]|nr:dihydropteroate synthase [Flavobacteriales bacterium]MBK7941093.1 dihydropteroate synthase [Flavobacteriales bacterium]MBK8948827.1 dihydropteroate synthase [Flavobacteriales bacterium]MBK9701121.1 dihydropteroate synthase [Flavobacteriales bacterium]